MAKELKTWSELNAALKEMGEAECLKLLGEEKAGKRRPSVLLRIYARYSVARKERELDELLTRRAKAAK